MLNDKHILRILAILLLGKIFLVVVFQNLPFPFSSYFFYLILWFGALFIFHPKLFTSKLFIYFYIYALLFLFLFNTVWFDLEIFDKQRIWNETLALFTAVSIYAHFITTKDYKGLAIVIFCSLSFITVTVITSLHGLSIYPLAARDLAGVLARDQYFNIIDMYQRMGIGGYGFFAGLTFVFPVLIGYLRNSQLSKIKRNILVLAIVLLFIGLLRAQYFANILIGSIGIVFALVGQKNYKRSIVMSCLILILFLIVPKTVYSGLLGGVAGIFDKSMVKDKFQDLRAFLEGGSDIVSGKTQISDRASQAPKLLASFLANPIFGKGYSNGHLHWLNKLSLFGLVGTLAFFILIWKLFKINFRIFSESFKFYYFLSMTSFIILGSMKSLLGYEIIYSIFLIIPGVFYLKYLKSEKKQRIKNVFVNDHDKDFEPKKRPNYAQLPKNINYSVINRDTKNDRT